MAAIAAVFTIGHVAQMLGENEDWLHDLSIDMFAEDVSGRVARPFGFALTDPGRRLSRTRLFPEVTRMGPLVGSRGA